ncbi:MAG TPA: FtsX-like permease family protein [Streptosporangiaceae bacterium]|nr:FtsX-like permease family protein [Streptosporangiaceae bacterium]
MRAALRWIRSDLRAHPTQVIVELLVVAGVLTALLLSATVLEGATNPWRGLFAQSKGAQIWLHLTHGTNVSQLRHIGGVTELAGPYTTTAATIVQGPVQSAVELREMTPKMPQIGRLLVRQGSWLRYSAPDGVVLEASFAQAIHAVVGTRLVVNGIDGPTARVRVIGIAATSDQGFYPDQTPGLAWVQRPVLRRVEPVAKHTEELVGIKIADPDSLNTSFVAQQAVAELSGAVQNVSTWMQVEQSMARGDPLLGLLLALFGLVTLGGAVLVILNATGGRVLVQLEDLATLKSLGFTPGQITDMVVAEHAAVGLAGTAVGVVATRFLTVSLLQGIPAAIVPAVVPLPALWIVFIACSGELLVILAAAFPAWRAGRVSAVVAVRRPLPSGHLSQLARLAMLSRFPPAVVLGARAAFIRRLPAVLTVGGLAVSMAVITIGLGVASTVDDVQQHPADIGLAAALTVSPGELNQAEAARIVAADRQVAHAYPSVQVTALLASGQTTITTLGLGTSARPYPFDVAQGSLYRAPGQAVASQGLLDLLHAKIGTFVTMQINGVPVIFHFVGRIVEPEYNGQVLAYGLDTLKEAGVESPPVYYSLVLRPGITASAARAHLLSVSGGRLDVAEVTNPAGQLGIIRPMLIGLIAVLALVGLASVLTASAVGIRDQLRDVGALRAIGLTPGQVMLSLISSTAALAIVAIAIGATAGLLVSTRLINLGAQLYGIGSGIGRPPSAEAMAVAILIAAAGATLTAIWPARRAATIPVAAMLRP